MDQSQALDIVDQIVLQGCSAATIVDIDRLGKVIENSQLSHYKNIPAVCGLCLQPFRLDIAAKQHIMASCEHDGHGEFIDP